jgi:beta-glucuronidase
MIEDFPALAWPWRSWRPGGWFLTSQRPVGALWAIALIACGGASAHGSQPAPCASTSAALASPWRIAPAPDAPARRPSPLIENVYGRKVTSLNGAWRAIVDPYENGYYDYRHDPQTKDGYFANRKPSSKSDRVEYDFDLSGTLAVPGDWNSQRRELFFYEGTVWYKTDFDAAPAEDRRLFVYFGAANYDAKVYVNGTPLGEHVGGFTPFNFELTGVVHARGNFLVVKVDNQRHRDAVPTDNTDWWNYGGLTRDVFLVDVPRTFIRDYSVELAKGDRRRLSGWVQLDGPQAVQEVVVRIKETATTIKVQTDARGFARIGADADVELWSPEHPKRYTVEIAAQTDRVEDRVGFRSLETRGADILLNGKSVFLRGISVHEQAPMREGRAFSREDARVLLGWVKDLGANFVRLAHYPHNEHIVRLADEMGLMVWAEIPVYWTIQWENPSTLENAKNQLTEMIARDKNRASVIVWSVGNETPESAARLRFMSELVGVVRDRDPSRLLSAALERREVDPRTQAIDDPLGALLDVVGCNEYLGWYDGLPDKPSGVTWTTAYDKPLIISEFGADALEGLHGDPLTRWTEEYQASVYAHQVEMLERIPFLRGVTPWILSDFRSPRRPLPGIQDYWNRKGLISDRGEKKQAFFVLQQYYKRLAERERSRSR